MNTSTPTRSADGCGGYTAVEVVVVAGIAGLLSTAAALSYFKWLPQYRLEKAAAELGSMLQQARMRAVSHSRRVEVVLDGAGKRCAVWEDANTNGVVDSGEQAVCVLDDAPDLVMCANATQGVYRARGSFESSSAAYLSVTVTVSGVGSRYVHVMPSGHSKCTDRAP